MTSFNQYGALTLSSWLLTAMIILSELSPEFKNILKTIFTHHWIGKIIITGIIFFLVGFCLKNLLDDKKTAYTSVIASIAVVLAFFLLNFFVLGAE